MNDNRLHTPPSAAVAAHRFGLGQPDLAAVGTDPVAWLLAQIGPADPQRGDQLPDTATALRQWLQYRQMQRQARSRSAVTQGSSKAADQPALVDALKAAAQPLRDQIQADIRAHYRTAAETSRPFAERLALFWANHFTVSLAKGPVRGLVGAFERDAIRPFIGGRFETLLAAAVKHPAMLRYLDNDRSAGPHSRLVQRSMRRTTPAPPPASRPTGLNENLAREVLELHTLGVAGGGIRYGGWGGYTQADVTAFARVLTGWRVPLRDLASPTSPADAATGGSRFDAAWHEPGPKQVLGRSYGEGPRALDEVLSMLARHPSTARFIAYKLARHFVADEPPPELVARLADRYASSDGDLPQVYRALIESPQAWQAPARKLKTPEEFVISTARMLQLGGSAFERRADAGTAQLGQRSHAAPSPAGWPDEAAEWLGPDALWKRVEWAHRVADRLGPRIDARALAQASLGPALTDRSRLQIERAADARQALALLLLAPEFQWR
jgi:uncharacterized protein (DUF1800 family)